MLAIAPLALLATPLCSSPADCPAATTDLCRPENVGPLGRGDRAIICFGMFGAAGGAGPAGGRKVMFDVITDHYSTLSVDALRTTMGGPWSLKEPFSQAWVGVNGRRTVGQRRGVTSNGKECNATDVVEVPNGLEVCYGWAAHDKPMVTRSSSGATMLANGLTAVVHLDMGVVNRVVWDSSCNLCPDWQSAEADALRCMGDGTNIACVDGPCNDCYATLPVGRCTQRSEVCAPKIYLAWLGTDKHGQPLLSAGSVLSRFQANSVASVTTAIRGEVQQLYDQVSEYIPGGDGINATNATGR